MPRLYSKAKRKGANVKITSILSEYLKAADLQGREVPVVISQVKFEKMDGKDRAVLHFIGKSKGLMLNKTNINNIVYMYGEETDNWNGKEIVLYEAMVDYQGRSTPAIRVKAPQRHQDPISSGPQRRVGGISDNMPPISHPIHDDPPF